MNSPIDSEYTVAKNSEGEYAIMYMPTNTVKIDNLKRHDLLWIMNTASNWLEKEELESPASSNPKN